jgi:predicted regulator of Ras-like GTPase activity (Roadblock/LC7/MglB family)
MQRSVPRDAAVADILDDLHAALPGASVALLSRGGGIFAGRVPAEVNRESYAALLAVMHGAGETGTLELHDELVDVEARLTKGVVIIKGAGKKMLLAAHLPDIAAADKARTLLQDAAARLASLF